VKSKMWGKRRAQSRVGIMYRVKYIPQCKVSNMIADRNALRRDTCVCVMATPTSRKTIVVLQQIGTKQLYKA